MATRIFYILSYDIRDKRRLQRVMRRIRKVAQPLQYSVYYAELYSAQMESLLCDLEKLIEANDDIRVYATAPLSQGIFLGRSGPPADSDALAIFQ